MKNFTLIVVLICFVFSASAQKASKESLGKYVATKLPMKPLPQEFESYKVIVDADDMNQKDFIHSALKVPGFKKMDKNMDKEPDFKLIVEAYPFTYSDPEKTNSTTTTKVDGVEKKTKTYGYKGKIRYKFKFLMKDSNDTIYIKEPLEGTEKISTSGHANYTKASEAYKSKANSAKNSITKSQFNYINSKLSSNYGTSKVSYFPNAYSVKVKRKTKFDYSDLISAYEIFVEAFKIIAESENNIEKFNALISPAIVKWENALKESNVDDKKCRINQDVTCLIYHNIGIAYFLEKDYQKAIENLSKCKEIKKSFGSAGTYIRIATDLQKRIEANNFPMASN